MAALPQDRNRLRLAARMLVELRTPKNAPNYQLVMSDLVRNHPAAESIRKQNGALDLDDEGIIIWYLSESMDSLSSDHSVTLDRSLVLRYYLRLAQSSILEKDKGQEIWPGGPSKFQLADAITEALDSHVESRASLAVRSLVGLAVPWPGALSSVLIKQLLQNESASRSIFRKLNRQIQSVYRFALAAFFLVFIVGLALLVVGKNDWFSRLGALLSTLSTLIGFFVRKREGETKELILSTTKLFRHAVRSISPSLMAESILMKQKTARLLLQDRTLFDKALSLPCGYVTGALSSMLRRDQSWASLALACTPFASPAIIKEALHVLRLPESSPALRTEIFKWLCQVIVTVDIAAGGAVQYLLA